MPLLKKAVAIVSDIHGNGGVGGVHGVASGQYCLLDANDNVLAAGGCSTLFDFADTVATIQQKLTQNIRDNNNDQSIVVLFL